ncbi:MAG: hypothetical protein HZA53_13230 [Planctomycetes bacterium]|nr:hypothetical protein [Planctomycetota bacterium]
MQRTLVFVVVLVVCTLGLVAWWAFRSYTTARDELARAVEVSMQAEVARAELAMEAQRVAQARELGARTVASSEAAIVSSSSAFGPPIGLELLVVEKGTKAPVAGAKVRALGFSHVSFGDRERFPLSEPEVEEQLASAPELVTDEQGRAWLPRGVRPGSVCARKGTAFGVLSIGETAEPPLRLELALDRTLLIRAIDGNARPVAGVPVGLRRAGAPANKEDFWNGLTEKDGIARVQHLDLVLGRMNVQGAIAAHLAILAREEELGEARIDPNALSEKPVDLIVPPCGSLDVRVHGPGGETVLLNGMNLADARLLDEHGYLPWEAPAFEPALLEPSHAFFPFVGTGLELYVAAMGGGMGSARKRLPGPMSDGERITLDLEFANAFPIVRVRVLDPDGEPLASRTMSAQSRGASGSAGLPVTTDAEGRFEVMAPAPSLTKTSGTLLVSAYDDEGARMEGVVAFPDPLQRGVNDLGDLLLQRRGPLARVRVVDDTGRGIAGAAFTVRDAATSEVIQSHTIARMEITEVGDGLYALSGFLSGHELACTATKSGHASPLPVTFTPPVETVVITLPRASSIAGRARLDADVDGKTVRLVLRYREKLAAELVRIDGVRASNLGDDGAFAIPDVRPGRVDLVFTKKGAKEPCFVLEDVLLLPGERVTDGRLDAIDLRGAR